jgi:hypothetical protein
MQPDGTVSLVLMQEGDAAAPSNSFADIEAALERRLAGRH